jgi:solute carrier family 25 carnitine/acylcarnitine transporter 20/29
VIKKQLTPAGSDPSKLNLGAIMLAGGSAGIAMWSIAIPPDVSTHPFASAVIACPETDPLSAGFSCALARHQTIKSRLQSAPHGTYSGFMDCVSKTVKADGVKALWKGFGPAMSRAFPANAAT